MKQFLQFLIFTFIQFKTILLFGGLCIENYQLTENDTINYIDTNCMKRGFWNEKYTDEERIGYYTDGKETGKWEILDKTKQTIEIGIYDFGNKNGYWEIYNTIDNKKIKEEYYTNGILMKKIEFHNDKKSIVLNKTIITYFTEKYLSIFLILLFAPILIRLVLNNIILNKLNKTNYFVFFAPFWNYSAMQHSLECLIRFYWTKNEITSQKKNTTTVRLMRFCNWTFYANAITLIILALNKIIEKVTI